MIVPFHDSLTGFVWCGAFGIPTVAAVGILLFCPLRAALRRFAAVVVPVYPLPFNPALWAACGPVAGLFLLLFQNLFEELAFNSFFGPGLQFFKFCICECGGVSIFGKNG